MYIRLMGLKDFSEEYYLHCKNIFHRIKFILINIIIFIKFIIHFKIVFRWGSSIYRSMQFGVFEAFISKCDHDIPSLCTNIPGTSV